MKNVEKGGGARKNMETHRKRGKKTRGAQNEVFRFFMVKAVEFLTVVRLMINLIHSEGQSATEKSFCGSPNLANPTI